MIFVQVCYREITKKKAILKCAVHITVSQHNSTISEVNVDVKVKHKMCKSTSGSKHFPCPQVARCVPGADHDGPEHVRPQPADSPQPCFDGSVVRPPLQQSRFQSACGHSRAHGTPRLSQSPPRRRLWRGPR